MPPGKILVGKAKSSRRVKYQLVPQAEVVSQAQQVTRSDKPEVFYELVSSHVSEKVPNEVIQVSDLNNYFDEFTMDAERSFTPSPFRGLATEDGTTWMRQFDLYVIFKELKDEKPLNLLKVLLQGQAGEWLESLAAVSKDTLVHLQAAFTERYQTPDIC